VNALEKTEAAIGWTPIGGNTKISSLTQIVPQGRLITQPAEHVRLIHGGVATGHIAISTTHPSWRTRWYEPDDIEDINEWAGRHDVYLSYNDYYYRRKSVDALRQLLCLHVDIDLKRLNLTSYQVMGLIDMECVGDVIPEPAFVTDTGNGLHLGFLIEPVPFKAAGGKAYELYSAIQRYLANSLAYLGADTAATDGARSDRLAGTINSKTGRMVIVDHRHSTRWTLKAFQEEWLPERQNKRKGTKTGRKPKVSFATINKWRIQDIEQLVEMRRISHPDDDGYRHNLLWVYSLSWMLLDPSKEAEDAIWELGQSLRPPLPRADIRAIINTTKRQAKNHPHWAPGNEWIINNLAITKQEQELLRTLRIRTREEIRVADRERKRRERGGVSREEYKAKLTAEKEEKLTILRRALEITPNATNKQLADALGLSVRQVQRLKKLL
jgi:hypothetical protein